MRRRAVPLLLLAGVVAGCGGGSAAPPSSAGTAPPGSAPSTTAPSTTAPSTTASSTTAPPATTAAPTTVAYHPSAPQASPDSAAALLVSAWSLASRQQAATVADPSAVATLFAIPYPGDQLQFRGCSEAISPATCTYHLGSSLIQVGTSRVAAGWYVSSVTVEH